MAIIKQDSKIVKDNQLVQIENVVDSQAKADIAEQNAKDYTDQKIAQIPAPPVTSVNGKTGAVSLGKGDVGLGNVDNVKQATKTEFDAHVAETVNWQRFKLTGDNGRSKVPPYNGDVNNLKDTGMYGVAEGAVNAPVPTMGVLLVYNQDGQHIRQVWYAFWGGDPYENRVYTRSSFNGGDTWTSWAELITSSGGTLTRDLFIESKWPAVWLIDTDINNRINILHDNSAFYVQLRDAAGNWIRDLLKLTNDGVAAQLGTNNIWHAGNLPYETGSWTPDLRFGGNNSGITYSKRVGRYTRIGNVVYWAFEIQLSSKGSATGLGAIYGLPYNIAGGMVPFTPVGEFKNISLASQYRLVSLQGAYGANYMVLNANGDDTDGAPVGDNVFSNSTRLSAHGMYYI
jgi:hypothetical protein